MANQEQQSNNSRDIIDEEFYQRYQNRGLNYKSNLPGVNNRDASQNLIVDLNKKSILTIEPTDTNITMESVISVINTQFSYFSFPASTTVIDTDLDINVDLDIPEQRSTDDPIYARYKPIDQQQIPAGANINFAAELEMSEIEEGNSQKRSNRYYITKEIKNSGVDLRFRVKVNFRYDSNPPPGPSVEFSLWQASAATDFNTTYFYITRFSPDEKFTDLQYKEFFNFENPMAGGGRIDRYNVQEATKEVVIANSEFDVGDSFALFGLAGKGNSAEYSTINADQTYWSITDASKNVDEWNREI